MELHVAKTKQKLPSVMKRWSEIDVDMLRMSL